MRAAALAHVPKTVRLSSAATEPNEFCVTELDLDFFVRPIVALYKAWRGIERGTRPWCEFGERRKPERQLEVEVAAPRRMDFGGHYDRREGLFAWLDDDLRARTIYFEPVLRIDRVAERFPWAGIKTKAETLAVLTLHELGHFHDGVRGLGFDALDMSREAKGDWYRRVERDADRHAKRWWKSKRFGRVPRLPGAVLRFRANAEEAEA